MAFNKFVEAKAKNSLISSKIKSKEDQLDKINEENRIKKESMIDERIREAEKKIEEKLKNRKKLTTDDLIMLQK